MKWKMHNGEESGFHARHPLKTPSDILPTTKPFHDLHTFGQLWKQQQHNQTGNLGIFNNLFWDFNLM